MIFVSQTSNGSRVEYRDRNRYLWLLSVASPSVPMIAVLLLAVTGDVLWSLLPIAVYFVLVPILDWLIGENDDNPPDEVIEQ